MFSNCPRCETGKLDSTGTCKRCRYSLRVPCGSCRHPNIPGAQFCGSCGFGLNLSMRLKRGINQQVSFFQRLKIKKFVTGLAFGLFLSFFAFGTMGMITDKDYKMPPQPLTNHRAATINQSSGLSRHFSKDLAKFMANTDMSKEATVKDLENIIELLIKYLAPIAEKANKTKFLAESAICYSGSLHNFSRQKGLTRGGTAMILFHFLADFLEVNYRDFSAESNYADIPRFHFLSVPAAALDNLGFTIAENTNNFGVNKPVRMDELLNVAQNVIALADKRIQ